MGTDITPAPTPIFPTVGPPEGVSVFSGQGVGLQRSGCRSATAYAQGKENIRVRNKTKMEDENRKINFASKCIGTSDAEMNELFKIA